MGPMMPGYGFGQPPMDPHQMYLHQMMQHGQRGPPLAPFQSGPPPQSRPPPQSNALASLLQSLNQSATVSPTNSSTPTFNATLPQQQQQQSQAHTPPSQVDLQASTESLKLALFGPLKPEPSTAQQKTEDLKMALFGGSRPDLAQPQPSPKKEEVNLLAMLHKSSNASSPAPQPLQDNKAEGVAEIKSSELKRESITRASTSEKSTPQSSSKAKFTYVNPFHSFTSTASTAAPVSTSASTSAAAPASTASPTHSRTATPIAAPQDSVTPGPSSKRSSFSNPVPRREEPDAGSRIHDDQKRYQLDQLLPPHSAWNHRVQKLAKGSSSIPDGVYLSHSGSGITTYDTGLDNSDAIFSEDLETIPITLIPTDVEYHHGKMVAVSKGYISYAAKGGKIRVIQQSHGHRTLLRGHTEQVIDMGFSFAAAKSVGTQLLASIGKDSRLIIWDLSGSDVDSTDIAHTKYLELVGEPQSDQPRYSHIAWNPVHASQLALVNNDDHSVLVIHIQNLVQAQAGESPVVSETQVWPHATVIQAHDQAINDISFSRDGSVLVTASEDGTVKFWDLAANPEQALLNEFVPHGGLGVTNAMFVDQPDATTSRCVVTACRRGTELSLWHVGGCGPLDQLVFKEPPSSNRRSSVGKAALRLQEMRMFNFMGYDHETSSLVLANSARLSLFGLKVKVTSTSDAGSSYNALDQAAYIKATLAAEEASCTATFDFMIEYPMPQPVVSFVVMPDSSLEYNGFSVYCIQAKAVQQYIIKGLEPHDKHKCQTFVSAPPSTAKPTDVRPKSVPRTSTPKSANSPSGKVHDGPELSGVFKTEKAATDTAAASPAVASEMPDKESEKSIKLHGAVINGAIAKLKEKKRNFAADSQPSVEGSDKKEPFKAASSGRVGRKTSQDLSSHVSPTDAASAKKGQLASEAKPSTEGTRPTGRNSRQSSNRQQEAVEASPALEQTSFSAAPAGHITISTHELQSLFQAMEDKITTRFEKKLTAELELQHRKLDQEQISRQEVVLKIVSQTLAKNTEQLLVQTVNKEIQNSVVPSLNKIVGAAVERQLSRAITDATVKTLPIVVESAVSQNVDRVMSSPSFVNHLTSQVATSIRPSIEDSFKDSFAKVLIPSYQKATQAMFQQIHTAFQSGIEDLASATSKDHASIEKLMTHVSKMALAVDNIQSNLAVVAQAQSEHLSGNMNHFNNINNNQMRYDQQRRSVTSGLQRALQGEDVSAGHNRLGSRRTSSLQPGSPVESKQTTAIDQLMAFGDFEGAFTQALSTNDPSIVFHVCRNLSPRTVFQQTTANSGGTLSQPVLLALTHHLANEELSQDLGIKLTWLQETLVRLDPKDAMLGDHMARILPTVQMKLEETYGKLVSSGEASPHVHMLQMLLRYVNNMRS
ncbi:hypothetical protein EDD11_007347 [Mortierella claussenii]|nr:hypothetical protein EDD11_007347 [Mortierella claussenii]